MNCDIQKVHFIICDIQDKSLLTRGHVNVFPVHDVSTFSKPNG